MGKWLDMRGPVVADTVYDSGVLVAKDVSFKLPGIVSETADLQAMGTMSVPIIGRLEDMELTITKIGEDRGLRAMNGLDPHRLEFRWVQSVTKADGSQVQEGCKAFVRTMPASSPDFEISPGETSEHEVTYKVTRMEIFINGTQYLLVDRLSQQLVVAGKDYMSTINRLL